MRKLLFSAIGIFAFFVTRAQSDNYPQNYFRNPLDIPIRVAGGFGECRPNHFHTGLDIKTQNRENLKVKAAADGYVSRISISHNGYGHGLYITHPNGYTTVYAHLNSYYPELEAFVEKEQYRQQRWNVDINIPKGKFAVKKGQWVANSGNTGGSTAPHVHFEIRETATELVLNPILFGLPVEDTKAPVFKKIAIYDGTHSIYMQSPKLVNVVLKEGEYKPAQNVVEVNNSVIFLGTEVVDFTNNSNNWIGIYKLSLEMDQIPQGTVTIDKINFDLNRYVNAFFDYKTQSLTGTYLQGLYKLANNKLNFYSGFNYNGYLDVSDGQIHKINVVATDASGNESTLLLQVKHVKKINSTVNSFCERVISPDKSFAFKGKEQDIQFDFLPNEVYDNVCFNASSKIKSGALSKEFNLVTKTIPVQDYFLLKIKPNQAIDKPWYKKLVFVHHIQAADLPGNNPQDAQVADYNNGWVSAKVRTLGSYYVAIDTVAPKIVPLQKGTDFTKLKKMSFRINENLTNINSFRGTIDGNWVMFSRRNDDFTYVFDSHCLKGAHQLKIIVTDDNGNEGVYQSNFTN